MVAVEAILICVFLLLAEIGYRHDDGCFNLAWVVSEMLYGSRFLSGQGKAYSKQDTIVSDIIRG